MATKINNPNAIVVIYNYKDRLGDYKLSNNPFEIDQIILNSLSLKSVSTQKSKANPAGAFEFRLAPIKNWVTAITPGSWCVILMSNNKLNDSAKYGGGIVDEKSFKMMGRIESVRGVATVNQATGARETEYIVTGSDWGVVFNSKLYVDPIDRTPGDQKQPVGMAERFGYVDYLRKAVGLNTDVILGASANPDVAPGALARPQTDQTKGSVNHTIGFLGPTGSTSTPTSPLAPIATSTSSAGQQPKDATPQLPSARDNVGFILSLWGRPDKATAAVKEESGVMAKSQQVFRIPDELVKYMGFVDSANTPSGAISQILTQVGGKLTGPDTYANEDDSCGIVDFSTILGEHSLWQIMTSNSNDLINELIAEIKFNNGKPTLVLYNRVRPFAVNSLDTIKKDTNAVGDDGVTTGQGKTQKALVDPYISQYKHVKRRRISSSDVLMCSFGTNWRDRINFVEVTIARTLFQEAWASEIKLASQFIDEASIGRDGLLSMIASTSYVPATKRAANPEGVSAYKHAIKEWYFNTHKMLNGTINLIGQDQYIQVGDNIMVESKVLNKNYNLNINQKTTPPNVATYMLAHVESVSHQTQVDGNGSRVFTTSINFVRGIITNDKGDMIVSGGHVGAVDQDASLVEPSVERNRETINTSGSMDPDRQKYPIKKGDKDYLEE
jgi:hypothetical protein